LEVYHVEYFPQPATPYIDLYGTATDPASYAAIARAPYAKLPPQDLAQLAADPVLRSRFCELAATVLLPPLRRRSVIFATKSHLTESIAPARLDPLLPGIGKDWTSFIGTLSLVFGQLVVYAAQFESLPVRWEHERFDLLQPDSPGVHPILLLLNVHVRNDVAKKEVELIGMTAGSRSLAGGSDFAMRGGAKETET
jgi:hypothetical protein